MKQVIVSVNSFGTRAVDVDDKFICFYTVKDNSEPSIIIPDESDRYVFFESMQDPEDFKTEKIFYVNYITNVYDLVKDCMHFYKECI
jgi:hypothetical protein